MTVKKKIVIKKKKTGTVVRKRKKVGTPVKGTKVGTPVELADMQSSASTSGDLYDCSPRFVPVTPPKYPLVGQDESNLVGRTLDNYAAQALNVYGSYVVEDRAVCDIRDGLKPVHRAILWSMYGLGLKPTSPYKKSARTVGDALGRFHPHGDQAAYEAMVTISQTVPPAVDGQGNWGTPLDNAAAMRYTEARLSRFAQMFLLDSDYLKVTKMVPNFSNDDQIPLHLPALLPYLFFNSTMPAPAYGVKAGHPSFTFKSLAELVVRMLKGEDFDAKQMAKVLKINHQFGCYAQPSQADVISLFETGKGSVTYVPKITVDASKKVIYVQSFVPGGFSSVKGIDTKLASISNIDGVASASSTQGKKNKNAGPHGACWDIAMRRGVSDDRMSEIAIQVEKTLTCKVSYSLGITVRQASKPNLFRYMDFVSYFNQWIKYRVALETRMLKHRIERAESDMHIQEVYLFAVDNLPLLLKHLPKILASNDVDAMCAKLLKVPVEDAKIIMSRQVRQLAKMERTDLVNKIKAFKQSIKGWNKDLKNPGQSAARDTCERVSAYLKKPDGGLAVGLS